MSSKELRELKESLIGVEFLQNVVDNSIFMTNTKCAEDEHKL